MTRVLRLTGRGAGHRRPALVAACSVALAGLLAGCAVGGPEEAESYAAPRPSLAGKAEVAAKNRKQQPAGKGAHRGADPSSTSDSGTAASVDATSVSTDDSPGGPSGPGGGKVSWSALADTGDATQDHGDGPAYADVTALSLAGSDKALRIEVQVAGVLPGVLADREVQGVGIDVFRSDDVESDYQVFLDGGDHGWRAFLQTPDGFVRFRGTFAVSGRRLVVTLPWSAVGGREEAEVSAFVDWSSGTRRLSTDGTERLPLQP